MTGEFIYMATGDQPPLAYIFDKVLPSAIVMPGILAAVELANHFFRRYCEYFIILGGALLVLTLLVNHPGVPVMYNACFIPILTSVFYFQIRKVLFSGALMSLISIALFVATRNSPYPFALTDFITTLAILACGTIISLGIMHRGIVLIRQLKMTLESRQRLLIQNIIMDRLSKIDPLTGLYNHMTFHEYFDRLAEQSDKFGFPLQLAVLDIDNFKAINDTYGHRAGDAVIKRVSEVMQRHVHPNDFVARYGGEEFAILFTEKNMNEALEILEAIRVEIAATAHEELSGQPVTISGGISEYRPGIGKEISFGLADNALYIAKKSGKNRIVIKTQEQEHISG
jgi:diguanylate cyclase (GGDEF)-like protein